MTHAVLVDTPWWVGSSAAEIISFAMATKADPKRAKRNLSEDDSDTDMDKNTDKNRDAASWTRYVVVEGKDKDSPLKINPFALSKAIQGVAGTVKSVKKLRSGSLLIECANESQSKNLLKTTSLATVPVQISALEL